ncbi:hypothetical protein ACFY94_27900 [Streptomyces griseorubiginosus]|uniref:hypothetical protein n=1 Tax=Streptomyces griseorubiginosus TaxID=67304 RepID=UPI0036EBCE66
MPRHKFIPRFYRESDFPGVTTWEPVTQETVGNEEWFRLVYTDETWMTPVLYRSGSKKEPFGPRRKIRAFATSSPST